MKIYADLHTHTTATGHAYSTLFENITVAKQKGLLLIAMTDHGPDLPDSAKGSFFWNEANAIPASYNGIGILKGMETNFLSMGVTDCDPELRKKLDIVIGGFHHPILHDMGIEANTVLAVKIIKSGFIDVITHPGNPVFPIDYDTVIQTAAAYGTAIELNSASGGTTRPGSHDNCIKVAQLCHKYNALVSLGSDAHFMNRIGDLSSVVKMTEEAKIAPENILNTDPIRLIKFLKERGHTMLSPLYEFLKTSLENS